MSRHLHDSNGKEAKALLQQAHATDGVAAGGEALDAAGVAEEPKTLRQQACATHDGEFERMMAKLDDLERQEAAAHGRASAAGPLLLLPGLAAWMTCCQKS